MVKVNALNDMGSFSHERASVWVLGQTGLVSVLIRVTSKGDQLNL